MYLLLDIFEAWNEEEKLLFLALFYSLNEHQSTSFRSSSGSSTDSSLPSLAPSSLRTSSTGFKQPIRGDTVGGHSGDSGNVVTTPRIHNTSSSCAFRSDRCSVPRDSDAPYGPSLEDPLQKAISSLTSIATSSIKSRLDDHKLSTGVSDSNTPRFCHECGHRYPVSVAKFCCQCGCRRAPLEN